jgi:hypothetical protein
MGIIQRARCTSIRLALAAVALMLLAVPLSYGADSPEVAAESAALSWLALIDGGDFAQSWTTAATLFRQRVTAAQWGTAAALARAPLGEIRSRMVRSATYLRSIPGAPDGEYVVIQFASSFEHKEDATETVTPMKDPDGTWRVSGYYIR